MMTREFGVLLAICIGQWAGNRFELQANNASLEVMRVPSYGASVSDVDGVGQGNVLPWANGRFVYEFSPALELDEPKSAVFEAACRRLLENTALRCTRRSEKVAMNDLDYVYVVDGVGDFSHVGRQGGRQILGILNWNNPIIVAHEIKHALGWGHEQQHPDRDRFVDILFENIPPEKQENFLIYDNGNEGAYDFDSVMHYHPADFARPTTKSIRVKPDYQMHQGVIGQRDHLSATDLQEIQDFYGDPSVEWCGLSRKPRGSLNLAGFSTGCPLVCRLQSDPSVGAWVPGDNCGTSSG